MALVIVQSDQDPRLQIRITRDQLDGLWGGTCPKCRRRVASFVTTDLLGRDLATDSAVRHLDAECSR